MWPRRGGCLRIIKPVLAVPSGCWQTFCSAAVVLGLHTPATTRIPVEEHKSFMTSWSKGLVRDSAP